MGKKLNIKAGDVFNFLTVISETDPKTYLNSKSKIRYLVRCKCGKEFKVLGTDINIGRTKSCSCYQKEMMSRTKKTHGKTNTRLYRIWSNMLSRCNNPKSSKYSYYGGKGITVCTSWEKFEYFDKDMSTGYEEDLQIDRIDNSKGYFKENCRWASDIGQKENRSCWGKTSKYRGVSKGRSKKTFTSTITVEGSQTCLGSFHNEWDAAEAYNDYVKAHNLNRILNERVYD